MRDAVPDALAAIAADADRGTALLTLLGASNSMARWLIAEPTRLGMPVLGTAAARAADRRPGAATRPPPADASAEELAQLLRVFKRRRVLQIAARDLLARHTLVETMTELSRLAEDALEVAVAAVALAARRGRTATCCGPEGRPLGFCVLGMGKLGGGELNFSSDIDLVYVYGDGGERERRRTARCALGAGVHEPSRRRGDEGDRTSRPTTARSFASIFVCGRRAPTARS